MVNFSTYPYPAYDSNKPAAGILAALVGISTIAWIIQSIQARFNPRRPLILLLISHLSIFIHLILRGALSTETRNSRAAFTAFTVFLAFGLRCVVLSNYNLLTQVGHLKPIFSRAVIVGAFVGAIGSAVLTGLASALSYRNDDIEKSFRLRQASAAIVLCMTILFYPIWFLTKTINYMTKQAIILLIISGIACIIVSIYIVITSVSNYYIRTNENELWFYIFQLTPIMIAQFTWTILHPIRSVAKAYSSESKGELSVVDDL